MHRGMYRIGCEHMLAICDGCSSTVVYMDTVQVNRRVLATVKKTYYVQFCIRV